MLRNYERIIGTAAFIEHLYIQYHQIAGELSLCLLLNETLSIGMANMLLIDG